MRALLNLVTDQKRARKNKSLRNGVANDYFLNCCRNVTIRDKLPSEESLRQAMMRVAGGAIARRVHLNHSVEAPNILQRLVRKPAFGFGELIRQRFGLRHRKAKL